METSEIIGQSRPLGYWIKHLHGLLEGSLDDHLSRHGLTRRHWQVLNVVAVGSPTPAELDTTLAPFLDEEVPTLRPVTGDLRERGWVRGEDRLTLTPAGVQAHEEVGALVNTTRARATEGVGTEEYLTAIGVLERMSANLESR
ncbi:MarR family winged helix-turn-helix transcriptional regulator [Streptosporangium sp. DT93]|uniref:MarR family winged helix-turn-helix transcriptional regulator n=1 Tax=Streptosporangium sp. DT93 TaxID=3393428 RepID=UPI003CF27BDC